ncbi:gamma-D-glutamate-meso-diaminopimelate muropeptidase [Phocicoccus schoeneichii]|uniref:Peptidoglycan endopeptidase LytE n=1 Tax=Phocicoccus schoeneichii TaxID=1812261 RepID=A0A6V7R5K0_9BACL|nr:LysM peptidoglycan-binding domain-containing protein [Jeotgalicoccus schoeneichii]GGH51222.1 gamma-D-glutamate-meso-diaminopimelate muropeptidase [Jeotgalicoccus schoeneichii]CAD2072670.1 hypothetical protein JEOSCH030_00363 [Jeotgalicoccus schoeneichii]
MKKTIFSVATLTALTGVSAVTANAEEVTVKSGDSLWSIAQAAGTTVADLKAENNLKSDLIHPGDVLSFNQTVEVSKDTYTVKAGDTLWAIGNEVGLSYQEIMTINNLNSDMIYPGQTLSLVASVEENTQTSETATVQEVEVAEEVQAEEVTQVEETQVEVVEEVEATETVEVQETGAYIVQKGDTLASISRATGVDVDTLKALNSLKSDMIFPDDVLVLTGEVPTTPAVEEVSEVEKIEVAVETVDQAAEKAEADRVAAEQAAVEKAEADRVAAEQAAVEKAEADRVAAEQAAARQAEADRQAAIKAEEERVAAQRAEEARIQAQKEQQRIAAQKAAEKREREAAAQKAAQQASQPVSQGNGNAYTIALNLSKGKSYVYGANSAYAVDCSSFAQQFMAQYKGKNIPRTTWAQRDAGTRVSNPQPGDLVFFNNYSHVGVYVGNGMMVDALNPSEGVGLRAVSYVHGYVDGYYRY